MPEGLGPEGIPEPLAPEGRPPKPLSKAAFTPEGRGPWEPDAKAGPPEGKPLGIAPVGLSPVGWGPPKSDPEETDPDSKLPPEANWRAKFLADCGEPDSNDRLPVGMAKSEPVWLGNPEC